jgi:hypothetical protein
MARSPAIASHTGTIPCVTMYDARPRWRRRVHSHFESFPPGFHALSASTTYCTCSSTAANAGAWAIRV